MNELLRMPAPISTRPPRRLKKTIDVDSKQSQTPKEPIEQVIKKANSKDGDKILIAEYINTEIQIHGACLSTFTSINEAMNEITAKKDDPLAEKVQTLLANLVKEVNQLVQEQRNKP